LDKRIFLDLVRHFFGRFFDKESLSPQGQPEAGVIQTLGLLVPPGGFVCLLTAVLHPQGWDLVGLRFLFICYSMVAMGVVMVFEWEALFPDRRDYLILTPLPLRVFTLFVAKMVALLAFLAIFLAAINFLGVLLWPAVESRGNGFAAMGAHLAVTASAGLFSALAIAALQGVLVTAFRGAAYRRVSVFAQTAVMVALILCLFLAPLMGSSIGELCRSHSPLLRWFPGFWFAGLYEQMRPVVSHARAARVAAAGSALAGLGGMAIRSIWVVSAIFALCFLPEYRSHARRALETAEPNPRGPGRARRALDKAAQRWLRDPVEHGVFQFIGQTIGRSLKHRLFLATYGGFGAAVVILTLASGSSPRRAPLILSFVLVSGLRAAFNFPSDLRANWAFQVSETSSVSAYVRATRKWVALYAVAPLFLALAGIEAIRAPLPEVAFHLAFGTAASVVLIEALFLGFHKVPFTCSHFPGKVNLVFLSVMYVFGFTLYSSWMASLEDWLWSTPAAVLPFFAMVGGGLLALGRTRERMLSGEAGLEYEDDGNPVVRTLGLTEQ
jgi:hypothetical protein